MASLDATRAQMSSIQGRDMIQTAAIAAQNLRSFCRSSSRKCNVSRTDNGNVDGDGGDKKTNFTSTSTSSLDSDTNNINHSESATVASLLKLLDDSPLLQTLQFVVDPLRLTMHFEGESAVEVDEQMCEGK